MIKIPLMMVLVGCFKHDPATDNLIAKLLQFLSPFPHHDLQGW
jgi:hypothetical protein